MEPNAFNLNITITDAHIYEIKTFLYIFLAYHFGITLISQGVYNSIQNIYRKIRPKKFRGLTD
jgi:hypothetical protein